MHEAHYITFSRGTSRFCLDVRHVREIVDGSGFALGDELPGRSVSLRSSRLQLIDISASAEHSESEGNLPRLIVVELDCGEATAIVGVVADTIDSKLGVSRFERQVANCIDAEQMIRERLPASTFFSAH